MNLKSDAMWVGTKSEDTSELAPTEGDVTRLRVTLEGERAFGVGEGATFTPSAEVGLRHDGGDAETGTGPEVGAGLGYVAGTLTVEGEVRTLVAHAESGYEEWGMSGAKRRRRSRQRADATAGGALLNAIGRGARLAPGRGITPTGRDCRGQASVGSPPRRLSADPVAALALGMTVPAASRLLISTSRRAQ